MNFTSDNVSGIAPEIMNALVATNTGSAAAYGEDAITQRLNARFSELFEGEARVFPVVSGTAANALALATLSPPWGAIFCHEQAHILLDEANAPEFYTGGAKLIPIAGDDGKITPERLERLLPGGLGSVHSAQPSVVSLTQANECGAVYSPSEIKAIADVAHKHGLLVHMDGARFANAVAFLGASPADVTWRVGVDVLSFGATKNGALAAEAVVFFGPDKAQSLASRRKRAGHLLSKMRFVSAQLEAYVADGLWLRLAAQANAMAARLAQGLTAAPGARLRHPVEINEIFVELPEVIISGLLARGFEFYRWDGPQGRCIRLVTSWDTTEASVDQFIETANLLAGP